MEDGFALEKKHNYTIWYILSGLALVIVLTVAVIINNNQPSSNQSQIPGTIHTDNGDLKINWNRYSTYDIELTESLTIAQSGTYHITGSLTNGNIIVKVPNGVVKLILDNVTIANENGPAIACYEADDLVIELVGSNTLSDSKTYSADYDEDVTAAIYSKGDLTFEGDGTLNLTANFQDGIVSKDDLKFNSGSYNITAVDDGIRGKDSVYIVDGEFDITAKSDGIRSTNETTQGKGFVLIEKGNINIAAGDDGIHAYNMLLIQDGTINITKSYEGLEAQVITINGGDISIIANDDGINAGGGADSSANTRPGVLDVAENCTININGGSVYVNSAGDGIDSNGYVYFNGGYVVVDGPTNNGNGALDAGINISISGGTVIAVGASGMAETLGNNSTVNNASIYFASAEPAKTIVTIKDSSDNIVIEYTSAKAFNHMSVGTKAFKTGETYTIYVNNEKYQTFTISSITTVVGNSAQNLQQNGPRR